MKTLVPASTLTLSSADQDALADLFVRGTPKNTLRAYERDMLYVTAWKATRFGTDLVWPEKEDVALAFILDHARDLAAAVPHESARTAAEALIAAGLRKSLACPSPATLDRRIASWRAFHQMRNLPSPFDAQLIRQTRAKARRAAARPRQPQSRKPIDREILKAMLATCEPGLRGLRDKAILLSGWASGGRRRSELSGLRFDDLSLTEFEAKEIVWFRLLETKTTSEEATPRLLLKGEAARVLVAWLDAAGIAAGPVFRPISKAGRPLPRGLSPDGIYQIVKRRLKTAGLSEDFASPHGLRSGFLTQAALDGAPIQAAMRLSLHRSIGQAQRYYDDVELADNPAAGLWES